MSSRMPAIVHHPSCARRRIWRSQLNSGGNAIVPQGLRGSVADDAVHEGELRYRHLGDDEGVEVAVSYAAVDVVKRQRQRHPPLDERLEVARAVDVGRLSRPRSKGQEFAGLRLDLVDGGGL